MKKIVSLLVVVAMFFCITACAGKKPSKDFTVAGTWTVKNVNIKSTDSNITKSAVARVLGLYFTEGVQVTFEQDGTGVFGGAPVTYSYENSTLTITWDNSKNFTFEVKQTKDGFNVNSNDALSASFVK